AMLVDGGVAQALEVRPQGGGALAIGTVGSTRLINNSAGKLQGLTELINEGIPGVRAELDRLAQAVVTAVNAAHVAGHTGNGTTGVAFFDPAGVTATTIALSADVLADVRNVVAGTS